MSIKILRMSGMTLVELMIAMAIGVFLLTGILSVYISNKDTYRFVQMKARQQENVRLGSTIFAAVIRQAGYIPDPDNTATALQLLNYQQGKEASFLAESDVWSSINYSAGGWGGSGVTGDGEVVSGWERNRTVTIYKARGSYTKVIPYDYLRVRFKGGPGIIKCDGSAADPNTEYSNWFFINTFRAELQCFVSIGTTLSGAYNTGPLLGENSGSRDQNFRILGMAVWFGEDTDGDGAVDVYNRSGGVTDWTNLYSLEVKLTAQSGTAEPETISYLYDLPNIAL